MPREDPSTRIPYPYCRDFRNSLTIIIFASPEMTGEQTQRPKRAPIRAAAASGTSTNGGGSMPPPQILYATSFAGSGPTDALTQVVSVSIVGQVTP